MRCTFGDVRRTPKGEDSWIEDEEDRTSPTAAAASAVSMQYAMATRRRRTLACRICTSAIRACYVAKETLYLRRCRTLRPFARPSREHRKPSSWTKRPAVIPVVFGKWCLDLETTVRMYMRLAQLRRTATQLLTPFE